MTNLAFLRGLSWPPLRQWQQRRQMRRRHQTHQWHQGSGRALPRWALSEVTFTPAQAQWLCRTLCAWHALPWRDNRPWDGPAVLLASLTARLAAQGIDLRACRLADARALNRGDVLILGDEAAARLFGAAAGMGGGMALVIDAGPHTLRLSPALAADPLSCRSRDLHGSLLGWVLRGDLQPALRGTRQGWGEDLAAVV